MEEMKANGLQMVEIFNSNEIIKWKTRLKTGFDEFDKIVEIVESCFVGKMRFVFFDGFPIFFRQNTKRKLHDACPQTVYYPMLIFIVVASLLFIKNKCGY